MTALTGEWINATVVNGCLCALARAKRIDKKKKLTQTKIASEIFGRLKMGRYTAHPGQ